MKVKIVVITEGEGQLVDVAGDGPGIPWSEIIASACASFDQDYPEELDGRALTVRCLVVEVPDSLDLTPEEALLVYHERAKEGAA